MKPTEQIAVRNNVCETLNTTETLEMLIFVVTILIRRHEQGCVQ